jgi:hypothetical protein
MPDGAGQEIADFAGRPGGRYQMTCKVIRPVEELDQMRPQVRVALDPMFFTGDLILIGVFIVLAVITGTIGLVAAVRYFEQRGTEV